MVWASTKLVIWDDIFPTFKIMSIEYKGKNPHLLYKKINRLLRDVFRIPEGNIQEKEYTWNKTDTGDDFRIDWEAMKQLDNFSYLRVDMTLTGFSSGGVGKATIQFRPTLITEYPQDSMWQQNILYELVRRFWHTIFYGKRRDEYFSMGKNMAERFEREVKDFIEELK